MKHRVIVTFEIDPTEYWKGEDTPAGSINIVERILNHQASISAHNLKKIECENDVRTGAGLTTDMLAI